MASDKDIPPAAGKLPPQSEGPEPRRGAVGTGDGYSGEEYDSAGQVEWRDEDRTKRVPPDGEVRGSGVGGAREEYDPGTATGAYDGDVTTGEDQPPLPPAPPAR
ncbi:MAG: hypothetical protein ACTHMG_14930 [Sphingomonas sp.]